MDAKDLRIGNLVSNDYSDEIIIYSINNKGINLYIEDDGNYPECAEQWLEPVYSFNEIKGIPLTEEWLLKFGFEERNSKYEECDTIDYILQPLYFDMANQSIKLNGVYQNISYPIYVHQLQNLYFALTQTELYYEAK